MKKILLMSIFAISGIIFNQQVHAETAQGKVKSQDGMNLVIITDNGNEMMMITDDNTTYRKKKIHRSKKGSKNMQKNKSSFQPIVEEDDWVEVIYNAKGEPVEYIVEDIIIYED